MLNIVYKINESLYIISVEYELPVTDTDDEAAF